MDDVDRKIAAMEEALAELRARIEALGDRLARGENAVRAELNPAIRRRDELSRELRDLRRASGRLRAWEDVPVLYGPPSRFPGRGAGPPAPMYGPPGVSFWRRFFRRK